jgi:Ni/Co efflux regulator RcnB
MKTLAILSLAASAALFPQGASAQTAGAPVARQMPNMSMRAPAGTTWQHRGPAMSPRMAPSPRPHMQRGPVGSAHPSGSMGRNWSHNGPAGRMPHAMPRPGKGDVVIHRGGARPGKWGQHMQGDSFKGHGFKGNGFKGHFFNKGSFNRHSRYVRIERGHRLPSFWFSPQYRIDNWQMYGFSPPVQDGHWIRYYDDALLIDRDGVVRDGRWGMDWDGYQDGRESGYYGSEADGFDDYAEGEDRGDYYDYSDDEDRYVEGGELRPAPPPAAHGGPYYGYGYYYPGTITVTETTVTTGGQTKVVVHKSRKAKSKVRHHKPKAKCDCSAPVAPYTGERG